jgi:hypothetical protein
MSDVTLDHTVAGWLVAGHLNQLYSADQDLGCCPVCCGPCSALKALAESGQLEECLGDTAAGCDYWVDGRVDRSFLTRAWRMTCCHEHSPTSAPVPDPPG